MIESRRNRRKNQKNKHHVKSDISRKDKIVALIALGIIFLAAAITAIYYSLNKSGQTLF